MKTSVISCSTKRDNFGYGCLPLLFANISRQTVQPDEVILVIDDGINEEVIHKAYQLGQQMAQKKLRSHVEVIPDGGTLVQRRNQCLREAKGDLLINMDDDDLYGPRYIENTIKYMEQTGSPAVLMSAKVLSYDLPTFKYHRYKHVSGPTVCFYREFLEHVRVQYVPRRQFQGRNVNEHPDFWNSLQLLGLPYTYTRCFCKSEDVCFMRYNRGFYNQFFEKNIKIWNKDKKQLVLKRLTNAPMYEHLLKMKQREEGTGGLWSNASRFVKDVLNTRQSTKRAVAS